VIVNIKPPDKHVNKINKPRRTLDSFDWCGIAAVAMIAVAALIKVLR
jgi:hypothetical protein